MLAEVTGSGFSRGFTSGFIGHYAPVESITEALGYNNVITRTAVAAGLGGTASALNGGSFANGAESAAYVHLYNSETKSKEDAQRTQESSLATSYAESNSEGWADEWGNVYPPDPNFHNPEPGLGGVYLKHYYLLAGQHKVQRI